MQTRDLVLVGLFAAIVAVLGVMPPIPVPGIPVPITAQTLGVMLAGSLLGAKRGGLALLVFLALVAAGLPVLSGGRGGIGVFAGPTAGFLVAWPLAAFAIGWLTERTWGRHSLPVAVLANAVGGILVIYAAGIAWLAVGAGVPFGKAFAGSLAFVPGDAIKAVLAACVSVSLKRYRQHPLDR